MTRPPSDHFNGKRFFYPGSGGQRGWADLLRWKLSGHPAKWPEQVGVAVSPLPPAPEGEGMSVTWIGHSTFLIRTAGANWLTDPVFSERIGPVRGFGPQRVMAPGIALADLPRIDGVLLSHDHYDHCDLPSLRELGARNPDLQLYAPLGHRALVERVVPNALSDAARGPTFSALGTTRSTISEMDWWDQAFGPGDARIELVPAKHWCRRALGGTNRRLWGGFYLRAGGRVLYFAGDSGFDEKLFRAIGERCGPPDLALIPIGAYEPRWFMRDAHMNPAEAVEAHRIIGAKQSIGMHWGTFQLTDEGYDAPVGALGMAKGSANFGVLAVGESLRI